MSETFDIDALEAALGQGAALRVLANVGGQRRNIPLPRNAAASALAQEIGPKAAIWIADRFGGEIVVFPSRGGREAEARAARLRADVIEAGLTEPLRSANDIAAAHGVTARRVEQIRQDLRREGSRRPAPQRQLPLFRDL